MSSTPSGERRFRRSTVELIPPPAVTRKRRGIRTRRRRGATQSSSSEAEGGSSSESSSGSSEESSGSEWTGSQSQDKPKRRAAFIRRSNARSKSVRDASPSSSESHPASAVDASSSEVGSSEESPSSDARTRRRRKLRKGRRRSAASSAQRKDSSSAKTSDGPGSASHSSASDSSTPRRATRRVTRSQAKTAQEIRRGGDDSEEGGRSSEEAQGETEGLDTAELAPIYDTGAGSDSESDGHMYLGSKARAERLGGTRRNRRRRGRRSAAVTYRLVKGGEYSSSDDESPAPDLAPAETVYEVDAGDQSGDALPIRASQSRRSSPSSAVSSAQLAPSSQVYEVDYGDGKQDSVVGVRRSGPPVQKADAMVVRDLTQFSPSKRGGARQGTPYSPFVERKMPSAASPERAVIMELDNLSPTVPAPESPIQPSVTQPSSVPSPEATKTTSLDVLAKVLNPGDLRGRRVKKSKGYVPFERMGLREAELLEQQMEDFVAPDNQEAEQMASQECLVVRTADGREGKVGSVAAATSAVTSLTAAHGVEGAGRLLPAFVWDLPAGGGGSGRMAYPGGGLLPRRRKPELEEAVWLFFQYATNSLLDPGRWVGPSRAPEKDHKSSLPWEEMKTPSISLSSSSDSNGSSSSDDSSSDTSSSSSSSSDDDDDSSSSSTSLSSGSSDGSSSVSTERAKDNGTERRRRRRVKLKGDVVSYLAPRIVERPVPREEASSDVDALVSSSRRVSRRAKSGVVSSASNDPPTENENVPKASIETSTDEDVSSSAGGDVIRASTETSTDDGSVKVVGDGDSVDVVDDGAEGKMHRRRKRLRRGSKGLDRPTAVKKRRVARTVDDLRSLLGDEEEPISLTQEGRVTSRRRKRKKTGKRRKSAMGSKSTQREVMSIAPTEYYEPGWSDWVFSGDKEHSEFETRFLFYPSLEVVYANIQNKLGSWVWSKYWDRDPSLKTALLHLPFACVEYIADGTEPCTICAANGVRRPLGASRRVTFYGIPYNPSSLFRYPLLRGVGLDTPLESEFEQMMVSDEAAANPDHTSLAGRWCQGVAKGNKFSYVVGSHCAARMLLYHRIQHFCFHYWLRVWKVVQNASYAMLKKRQARSSQDDAEVEVEETQNVVEQIRSYMEGQHGAWVQNTLNTWNELEEWAEKYRSSSGELRDTGSRDHYLGRLLRLFRGTEPPSDVRLSATPPSGASQQEKKPSSQSEDTGEISFHDLREETTTVVDGQVLVKPYDERGISELTRYLGKWREQLDESGDILESKTAIELRELILDNAPLEAWVLLFSFWMHIPDIPRAFVTLP